MPELPEVETIVRELNIAQIPGHTIKQAEVFWAKTIATPDVDTFCKTIVGQKIVSISRRGKWIVFTLSRNILLIHLRMTGKLFIDSLEERHQPYERVRLTLDDETELHYVDPRKFGKWSLLPKNSEILANVGVEPLSDDFALKVFQDIIKNKKTRVKSLLLDQKYIAGLGNIYVDEALWESKVHPERRVDTLKPQEIKLLHKAIVNVLKGGVERRGTSFGTNKGNYANVSGKPGTNKSFLQVFRKEGQPCPRCGETILKMVVSQRGTHICPHCQKV
ncbi:MAG: DNA-formamidopyrimidine glycosylase [Chlamydiales bacterium]|nr:DNA-formamidopyrimidine glycosylase [Chlamydiales bacterium]